MAEFLFEVWAHYDAREPEAELVDSFTDYAPAAHLRRNLLAAKLCDDCRVNIVGEEDYTPEQEALASVSKPDNQPHPDLDAKAVANNATRTMQAIRALLAVHNNTAEPV